ncbi:hypothetical protein [Brucella anthropi]|uniref:hypothetical protein n=1 Tax=Brucella anthropi TaxID=529 RepID=UPI00235F5819|nr:hypothetical protein [Brucella anthropi]
MALPPVDPSTIGALLKSAIDGTKKLIETANSVKINNAVIEIQNKLLMAQSEVFSLVSRVSELEAEAMRMKNWEAEKERYDLQELPPGVFIYALKESVRGSEPAHNICANCYNKGVKSILHVTNSSGGIKHWKCYCCGFEADTGERPPLPNRTAGGWMAQ